MTGGVILFARNYESRTQLTGADAAIHAARPGLLIAVDHEGGRVQRFRTDGFTRLPAMGKLGEAVGSRCAAAPPKRRPTVGFILAAELRACGIDLSFTPVLDLNYRPIAGDRRSRVPSRSARGELAGQEPESRLALAGMANCGKHFPGHGFAQADSHVAMPVDDRSLTTFCDDDARRTTGWGSAWRR